MERVNLSKEVIVKNLIGYALSEVERKYGKGEGDGKTPRSYHNRVHTQDVLTATLQIANSCVLASKISDLDIPLIQIAAAFHDVEQDLGGGQNEKESARLAEEEMRKTGLFEEDEIQKVKGMILATRVYFENGVMKQSAREDYLTQIIADADLSSLGKESGIYWERAMRFLKEVKRMDTPSREDEITFAKGQIPFLENHRFYTEAANSLFPHKPKNIIFMQEHIKSLEE